MGKSMITVLVAAPRSQTTKGKGLAVGLQTGLIVLAQTMRIHGFKVILLARC